MPPPQGYIRCLNDALINLTLCTSAFEVRNTLTCMYVHHTLEHKWGNNNIGLCSQIYLCCCLWFYHHHNPPIFKCSLEDHHLLQIIKLWKVKTHPKLLKYSCCCFFLPENTSSPEAENKGVKYNVIIQSVHCGKLFYNQEKTVLPLRAAFHEMVNECAALKWGEMSSGRCLLSSGWSRIAVAEHLLDDDSEQLV